MQILSLMMHPIFWNYQERAPEASGIIVRPASMDKLTSLNVLRYNRSVPYTRSLLVSQSISRKVTISKGQMPLVLPQAEESILKIGCGLRCTLARVYRY